MIATYTPERSWPALKYAAGLALVACASLAFVAATLVFQEAAIANALFVIVLGLAIWRPRYGIYAVILLVIAFEPDTSDPFMRFGWYMQTPISASSDINVLVFSPVELILLATLLRVLIPALIERRSLRGAQVQMPLLVFLGLLLCSLAYGIVSGGVFHIALQVTRSLVAGVLIALILPSVFRERGQVHHAVNLLCVAAMLLSVDIIWRRFTLLAGKTYLDLSFDHDSPVFMNVVVVLLLARLVWPASGRQRLAALVIPLILYAEMVTERRAGWVSLDVGLVLITIFVFRLRRKVFFFLVVPLLLVYTGYLGAFWNATGPLAQPARAIRSINDPEGRDQSANFARLVERQNIRLNIKAQPLTGLGFGKQYAFYYPVADLSFWPLWHYVAHDQLLWLWMEMGPLGFITFLTICGAATARGVQLLKAAQRSRSAPYLVAIVSLVPMLLVYSYVDIALNSIRVMAVMGFALGAIGAWGALTDGAPRDKAA